jgi:hypothetical protein
MTMEPASTSCHDHNIVSSHTQEVAKLLIIRSSLPRIWLYLTVYVVLV